MDSSQKRLDILYYQNGQLKEMGNYVNNQLHGLRMKWCESPQHRYSQLYLRENFIDAKRHGHRETWYHLVRSNVVAYYKDCYIYGSKVGNTMYQSFQENLQSTLNLTVNIKDLSILISSFL